MREIGNVLGAMIVALSLEGVLPGLARLRRPVAVVRYDRIRGSRARANLRRIARRLSRDAGGAATVPFTDCRPAATRSSSASTGACSVLFLGA